jgi:uncharacterized membrane protein YgcG
MLDAFEDRPWPLLPGWATIPGRDLLTGEPVCQVPAVFEPHEVVQGTRDHVEACAFCSFTREFTKTLPRLTESRSSSSSGGGSRSSSFGGGRSGGGGASRGYYKAPNSCFFAEC